MGDWNACHACKGKGKMPCQSCEGTGSAKRAGIAKATKEIVAWLWLWSGDLFQDDDDESLIMSRTLEEAADKIERGEHLTDLKARKKAKS